MAKEDTVAAPDTKTPEAPAQPTEIKGTMLKTPDISDWGNNFQMVEPNVLTEDGQPTKEETSTEPAATEEEPKVEAQTAAPEPEEVVLVDDPGEFQPGDYGFEVTTYDSEGKRGRTQKISSIDQWEQFLDTDPNFGSATALLKAQRLATKMESGLERDRASYDTKKTEYDAAVKNQETREAASTQIANEINYLVDRGELPKVAPEYATADWRDPNVAKQPGVREQVALLNYMQAENSRRMRAGLNPLTSALDAWNAYQLEESKKANASRTAQVAEARREAGARVAGVAPNPVTAAPKGIMVGRGGSLDDLGRGNWET